MYSLAMATKCRAEVLGCNMALPTLNSPSFGRLILIKAETPVLKEITFACPIKSAFGSEYHRIDNKVLYEVLATAFRDP